MYALSRDVVEEEKAKRIPWPDSELLFGQDPDYQNDVGQIFHQIKDEVDNVLNYSKVIVSVIIHKIFSLARDWSKRVTWANVPQLKLGNI